MDRSQHEHRSWMNKMNRYLNHQSCSDFGGEKTGLTVGRQLISLVAWERGVGRRQLRRVDGYAWGDWSDEKGVDIRRMIGDR